MRARKRRAYLEYFHKNAAGEYVYSGGHYTFDGDDKQRKRAITVQWALLGIAAALTILGSFLPVPGLTNAWYVLIPYVLSVILVFMAMWSLGEITAGGEPLREYVYEKSVRCLKRRLLIVSVCAGLSFLGECVYVLQGGVFTAAAGVFLGWEMVAAAAAAVSFVLFSRLRWSRQAED